ncbi:hypothetical protein C8R44DRAFT_854873 [Mycena epipterygia]|nr:hypothetical protein C8R44DRAFT_854873 [Mycena epipterygia]
MSQIPQTSLFFCQPRWSTTHSLLATMPSFHGSDKSQTQFDVNFSHQNTRNRATLYGSYPAAGRVILDHNPPLLNVLAPPPRCVALSSSVLYLPQATRWQALAPLRHHCALSGTLRSVADKLQLRGNIEEQAYLNPTSLLLSAHPPHPNFVAFRLVPLAHSRHSRAAHADTSAHSRPVVRVWLADHSLRSRHPLRRSHRETTTASSLVFSALHREREPGTGTPAICVLDAAHLGLLFASAGLTSHAYRAQTRRRSFAVPAGSLLDGIKSPASHVQTPAHCHTDFEDYVSTSPDKNSRQDARLEVRVEAVGEDIIYAHSVLLNSGSTSNNIEMHPSWYSRYSDLPSETSVERDEPRLRDGATTAWTNMAHRYGPTVLSVSEGGR